MGPPPPLYDKKNGISRGRRSPAGSDGFPVSSFDGEPMGSVPIDPEFLGMSKTDLATRVKRAETMMQRYVSENQRLAYEIDTLRGSKTLIEIEHKAALESNSELLSRIESLEMSFLTGRTTTERLDLRMKTPSPRGRCTGTSPTLAPRSDR